MQEFFSNPAVIILGTVAVLGVIIWFAAPYFPAKCKECGWKGKQEDLLFRADHETLSCPNCRKVYAA